MVVFYYQTRECGGFDSLTVGGGGFVSVTVSVGGFVSVDVSVGGFSALLCDPRKPATQKLRF